MLLGVIPMLCFVVLRIFGGNRKSAKKKRKKKKENWANTGSYTGA